MQFWKSTIQYILTATLMLMLGACANTDNLGWVKLNQTTQSHGPALLIEGVVRYLDIEGGLFVIRTADNQQYHPVNLPKNFQQEGLSVQTKAYQLENAMSIGMVGTLVELIEVRKLNPSQESNVSLLGSTWRLHDLAGKPVVEGVMATLEFVGENAVAGNASCNRFHGKMTIDHSRIQFGHLATTRKFCGNAQIMQQESDYLAALQAAERVELKQRYLYIHTTSQLQPLRFTAIK
jgi:heat shock protein HslJ